MKVLRSDEIRVFGKSAHLLFEVNELYTGRAKFDFSLSKAPERVKEKLSDDETRLMIAEFIVFCYLDDKGFDEELLKMPAILRIMEEAGKLVEVVLRREIESGLDEMREIIPVLDRLVLPRVEFTIGSNRPEFREFTQHMNEHGSFTYKELSPTLQEALKHEDFQQACALYLVARFFILNSTKYGEVSSKELEEKRIAMKQALEVEMEGVDHAVTQMISSWAI